MIPLQPGDRVRLTRAARLWMFWARERRGDGSQGGWAMRKHLREFRRCVGVLLGPLDYNNVKPDHPDYDSEKVGSEVDVRWEPSRLRYGYRLEDLEKA